MPTRSLQTRLTLVTLALFLIGIWSMSIYASRTLRDDMQRMLGDHQFAAVSILATEIDQALEQRQDALKAVAENLTPAILGKAEAAQALLEQRPVLSALFNGGVIAMHADGTAIAEIPLSAGRVGVNYRDMADVAAALKEGKASINVPVIGKKLKAPVLGMAVPIRDPKGRVIGALSGVINLGKPNFLDKIAEGHYGKTGGYMLVAKQQRRVVTATDKGLILAALPAVGAVPLIDRFIQGYEGSGVVVNPRGVEVLGSAKGIARAGWYVAVALPTEEAFAPIAAMQRRMLLATLALTLLVGALTWWALQHQLAPLFATVKTLAALAQTDRHPEPLPIVRRDEIGELIAGFNRLLETLAQRDAALRDSEARYRGFFESSPDAIVVHRNNTIIFANDVAARGVYAGSAAALIGRDWHELIAPEDWPIAEARLASLARGEVTHTPPLERLHVALDGQVVAMESTNTRIVFDGQPAVLTVIRDITERKRAEERRLADARQQRDTLVREVHHRIKNNLQGVAGLLQRELGRFVELDPRLETAISQVNAIAVVHGLQSARPDETIRLCDSARTICKAVSELSQRPVLFSIEGERAGFRPVRVENSEAVSVALVLNELILNAVKHSPPDGAPPTVSLSADGDSARLVIRNALANSPKFDIDTGEGLGTGLRLVLSLLPARGARLAYELDAESFMLTRLELAAPVVAALAREADRS